MAWESTGKTVGADFFAEHLVRRPRHPERLLARISGRLTRTPAGFNPATTITGEPVSWDQAFALIADKLKSLASPDEVGVLHLGTRQQRSLPSISCLAASMAPTTSPTAPTCVTRRAGWGLSSPSGGQGTVVLDDFDAAKAIFVFGQNPGTNHPRMMNALRKAARQGARSSPSTTSKRWPRRFASPQSPAELLTRRPATISHRYLTPKLGGDMAAIRGMAKYILEEEGAHRSRLYRAAHRAL